MVDCVCFLFAACHISCSSWHYTLCRHNIHKIRWPMTCSLTSACIFSLLPTNQSSYTSARSRICCLLAPMNTQCCLVTFIIHLSVSLAWVSLIQPNSYITFSLPFDIPSGHISMSKHTHLSLTLSWIDSGLRPPAFPSLLPFTESRLPAATFCILAPEATLRRQIRIGCHGRWKTSFVEAINCIQFRDEGRNKFLFSKDWRKEKWRKAKKKKSLHIIWSHFFFFLFLQYSFENLFSVTCFLFYLEFMK